MEIKGVLQKKLPLVTGEGAKGAWKKQTFIIQTEGEYPKDVAIIAWGDAVDKIEPVAVGSLLNCFVNVESREYNEKWYTDVKLWKFDLESSGTIKQNAQMDVPPSMRTPVVNDGSLEDEEDTGLPF